MAFSAAFEEPETARPNRNNVVGNVTEASDQKAVGSFGAVGVSAVSTAVSTAVKTRDFEEKHHLTQRAVEATRSSLEAARDANRKYGVTEKIGQGMATAATKTVEFEREHQVRSRAMQAARASVDAARDANQKYGITDKIGQGAAGAYSKAKEIEQKHHVTSTVASGLKNGAATVASAATSLGSKATKNPFSAAPATEVSSNTKQFLLSFYVITMLLPFSVSFVFILFFEHVLFLSALGILFLSLRLNGTPLPTDPMVRCQRTLSELDPPRDPSKNFCFKPPRPLG